MKNDIKNLLSSIKTPVSGYIFKTYGGAYWGKDSYDNVVFGIISVEKATTIIESTKNLSLLMNVECEVITGKITRVEKLNILVLKNADQIDLFISLTTVFLMNISTYSFLQFFFNLNLRMYTGSNN